MSTLYITVNEGQIVPHTKPVPGALKLEIVPGTKTIRMIPHGKKQFQRGSKRSCCYEIIKRHGELDMDTYLKEAQHACGVNEDQAKAILYALANRNQKTPTIEIKS